MRFIYVLDRARVVVGKADASISAWRGARRRHLRGERHVRQTRPAPAAAASGCAGRRVRANYRRGAGGGVPSAASCVNYQQTVAGCSS